jgi:curved DNA-binding protein
MTSHYETLGVSKTATPDEIKKAYRKLASQHHPDKGGNTAKFQEIQTAYDVLGDSQKRSEYDNPRPQFGGFGGHPNNQNFDFDSIFSMFGTQFQNPHARRAQRAQMTLWITLTDVAKGGNRTVSVGTQHGTHAVEIDVPKGINDGDNVQYQGIGPGGMDMIVTFRIHPDPRFVRQHLNLHTEQTVNIWDLILGCDLPVRDILGNEFSMVVPARTQPGTILRLKGKGLPSRNGAQGDFMIKLQARIPDNISPELIEQITQNHSQ